MWRWPTTGVMQRKDLPQPLLWPQLQVSEGEKIPDPANAFGLSSERPMIGFCRARNSAAKRWPHYHYAELAKQLIDEGYKDRSVRLGQKTTRRGTKSAALSTEQQAWCRTWPGKPSSSRR